MRRPPLWVLALPNCWPGVAEANAREAAFKARVFSPARLAVFFPALVFGFMRKTRNGIGAAIWFHAFCNLLSEILTRGYL